MSTSLTSLFGLKRTAKCVRWLHSHTVTLSVEYSRLTRQPSVAHSPPSLQKMVVSLNETDHMTANYSLTKTYSVKFQNTHTGVPKPACGRYRDTACGPVMAQEWLPTSL